MRAASVAWLLASCLAATLAAEDQAAAPVPVPGERVQLWLMGDVNKRGDLKKITGTFESLSPVAITVRPRGASATPMTLKLSKVERIEVVRGTRSHWVEGAAIGFVPGAVFLGAVVYVMGCDDYNASCNTGEAVLAGLVGGVATAGVGALIGLAVKGERWVKVPLPKPKVALALAPMRGGVRAAITVRF